MKKRKRHIKERHQNLPGYIKEQARAAIERLGSKFGRTEAQTMINGRNIVFRCI